MKICHTCNLELDNDAFWHESRQKDGLRSSCKRCENKRKAEYRIQNADSIAVRDRAKQQRYRDEWLSFWENRYGSSPRCMMCKRALMYRSTQNNNGDVVNWDHRRGDEPIQGIPANWVRCHSASNDNQDIWEECDFGMLCSRCNSALPTDDRLNWLFNAVAYILGQGAVDALKEHCDGQRI